MTAAAPVDTLYVESGSLRRGQPRWDRADWNVYGGFPEKLPPAREYWMVIRYDGDGVPAPKAAAALAQHAKREASEAQARGIAVTGLQLDVDSPTGKLADYAALLREVRKQLPPAQRLSITALLDWFRDGTAMQEVAATVDEFVPQFYDVGGETHGAVAKPVDAARWAPRFSRYNKPFRIGISSFGRARLSERAFVYADVTPLHLAPLPGMLATVQRTPAGEIRARYEATQPVRFGWSEMKPGEVIEFALPTRESITAAVTEARKMGDLCAGVLFFRWPAFNESLAVYPDAALRAAGVLKDPAKDESLLHPADGQCAAVNCTDLYLFRTDPLNPAPVHYRFHASAPLEYFVPADNVPSRVTGPQSIEFVLPPWCGRPRLYVGRAVTQKPVEYRMEIIP